MSEIQRVLFPVDLSQNYQCLNATTRQMFDHPNIEIVLLYAMEEPLRSARGTEVTRAMAQLEFLANKEFSRARICRRVEQGRAADRILDYAQSQAVDLIIMPAGGVDSLRRRSLGRVTEEVLAGARCAVWMEWMTGSVECVRHICCAVALDGSSEAVLRRATEVAREFGAELTIIHAVAPEPATAVWWDVDAVEQELRHARMRVNELREKIAPHARMHVEAGHLDTVVSRALYRVDAALLVAAGQGESIIAASMACPVLRLATPTVAFAGLQPNAFHAGRTV